jgi:hypothetical protein
MITMATKMDTREFDRISREIEKAGPSVMAREIARKNAEKENAREALEKAAMDMGITANELASDIIAERTFIAENAIPAKGSKEFEAGMNVVESRERRSLVKAIAIAERATRPDYKVARELLSTVGNEKGIVVSSMPTGEIAVFATFRAIDPEYARAMAEKAIAGIEKVSARIADAENAIENAPLKKATPAMKKELADAEKAMKVARARMEKANIRVENSKAISADGIRLEEKARFDFESMPGEKAIESWELPNAIVRRPFRHFVRINSDRKNYSNVENEVIRNEIEAEKAIVRAMVKELVEKRIAEISAMAKAEIEAKRIATNVAYKAREAERKRNARKAKRNAR